MIYEPITKDSVGRWLKRLELRQALTRGVQQAAILGAIDLALHIERDKPWAFYTGVAAGGAAAAVTGLPYAAATLYVVGDALYQQVYKSPHSTQLRVFLNGVAYGSLETFAAAQVWETFEVVLQQGLNRVDIVSEGPGPNNVGGDGGKPITGVGPSEVTGEGAEVKTMTATDDVWTITYTIRDAKGSTGYHRIYVPYEGEPPGGHDLVTDPGTALDVRQFAREYAVALEGVIGGQITNCSLSITPSLPNVARGTMPEADLNEAAVVVQRVENGPQRVFRVPAFDPSRFTSEGEIDEDDEDVLAWLGMLASPATMPEGWDLSFSDVRGNPVGPILEVSEEFRR